MKKFLSVLASVGLVATASMSVVSCTKKDKTPTFKDYRSIKNWSLTGDNEIIPVSGLAADESSVGNALQIDGVKELVISTLANRFKNPQDVYANLKDYQLDLVSNSISAQYSSDKTKVDSLTCQVALEKPGNGNQNASEKVYSQAFTIKLAANAAAFAMDNFNPMSLTNLLKDSSNDSYLIQTINNLKDDVNNNKGNDADFADLVNIKSKSAELMQMDERLFNDLAKSQTNEKAETQQNEPAEAAKIVVPGFDASTYVRYKSVTQQIISNYSTKTITDQVKDGFKEYKDVLIKFNTAILNEMRNELNQKNGNGTLDFSKIFGEETTLNNLKFTHGSKQVNPFTNSTSPQGAN